MASLSNTLLSLLSLTAMATASPLMTSRTTSHSVRAPSDSNSDIGTKIWKPEMYNIYPQAPDLSRDPVAGIYLEAFKDKSQLEQVAIFRGIPADATNCSLGWSQDTKENRVFVLKGSSGLTRIRQLSGIPSDKDGVSFSSVKPFDDAPEDDGLGPDFTYWDEEQYDDWDHLAGNVDCREEIYLKIRFWNPEEKASLYMAQNEKNGFWIEYKTPSS